MSFHAGDVGIEVLESEGKLVGIEALGAASELRSLKLLRWSARSLMQGTPRGRFSCLPGLGI